MHNIAISSTVSTVGKRPNQTPRFRRKKSFGRRSSNGSSFLGRLERRLNCPLMGGSRAFSLIAAPNDGSLDVNDRTIVETVNRGKNAAYIERTFWYKSKSKNPLVTPQTRGGNDIFLSK
jgi:hypothetical protein